MNTTNPEEEEVEEKLSVPESPDFEAEVREWMFSNDAELSDTDKIELDAVVPKIAAALREASANHGIYYHAPGNGFLLELPHGSTTAEELRNMAKAVEILEAHGMGLSVGQSAKGYTYLNVEIDDVWDVK